MILLVAHFKGLILPTGSCSSSRRLSPATAMAAAPCVLPVTSLILRGPHCARAIAVRDNRAGADDASRGLCDGGSNATRHGATRFSVLPWCIASRRGRSGSNIQRAKTWFFTTPCPTAPRQDWGSSCTQ